MAHGGVFGQLNFGSTGTVPGYYTNKTTFLTEHPGLTLQDFEGIAPPGGETTAPAFSGFSATADLFGTGAVTISVQDKAFWDPDAPFASLSPNVSSFSQLTLRIDFDPPVRAAGYQLASTNGGVQAQVQWYNGATLLHNAFTAVLTAPNGFLTFAGYAAAVPT